MHEYDAALYYVTSIPECCVGYEEASKLIDTYYTQYVNYNCQFDYAIRQIRMGEVTRCGRCFKGF